MAAERTEDESVARNAAQFATTHWSVVLAAGDSASPDSQEALEKLCRTYWFPLYAFLRKSGRSPADAEDLTQGFFAYLLERHVIAKARQDMGRFRSFVMGCLKHYVAQQRTRDLAMKRGGRERFISLDTPDVESRLNMRLANSATAEQVFDREWGLTVLQGALACVERDYSCDDVRQNVFRRLRPFIQGDSQRLDYRQAAKDLGMAEAAVRTAVARLRRRYREALREAVAETVSDANDIDAEIRHLIQAQAT